MIGTNISSREKLKDTASVHRNYVKVDTKLRIEFAVEILLKGNLACFSFHEKPPRVIIGRFYFSLSVISVFKNTYFVDNTASKYMPTSSSGVHLLENQKGNWLYFDFQWSILSKTFQELFCVYVIFFTYSLSLESNPPSLAWDFCYSSRFNGVWSIGVVCLLMHCPKAIIKLPKPGNPCSPSELSWAWGTKPLDQGGV